MPQCCYLWEIRPQHLRNRKQDNYMLLKISNDFKNTETIFLEQQRKMIHEKDLRKTAGALWKTEYSKVMKCQQCDSAGHAVRVTKARLVNFLIEEPSSSVLPQGKGGKNIEQD